MKCVIQRVQRCSVTIDTKLHSEISQGMMILVGIEAEDGDDDIDYLVSKISQMRIFDDKAGVMNLSVKDIEGEVMVISQFTLHASTKKGNRPSYIKAARPEVAIPIYEQFIEKMEQAIGKSVATGSFGADMQVSLVNDGPVTIIVDSKNRA